MVQFEHMLYAIVGLPLLAIVIELLSDSRMPERHHIHHDTYTLSPVVNRTLALVMMFMGVMGAVTGWLCRLGVFKADPLVPLGFFVAFQATLLVMVCAVTRYRVMAYDDRMTMRPAFGRTREIAYDDIARMEWVTSLLGPHLHDLLVVSSDGTVIRLWCMLDIEQLLLRIDRSDSLEA